jgi:hypothetical protein
MVGVSVCGSLQAMSFEGPGEPGVPEQFVYLSVDRESFRPASPSADPVV